MTDRAWMDRALCRGTSHPEDWFPEANAHNKRAREICQACPVRVECLAYAWKIDANCGIWGGLKISDKTGLWS